MCGVPFHAVDGYIARLVKKGFRVAICDQVEDPRKAKGIVKREVVRVVSPGTLTDASYLDAREPAFLMAVAPGDARRTELDASAWRCSICRPASSPPPSTPARDGLQALADELAVLRPREIVVPATADDVRNRAGVAAAWPAIADAVCRSRRSTRGRSTSKRRGATLLDQLRAGGLEGFGLDRHPAAVAAAGALVHYLRGDAEGRPRARPGDRLPAARRRAAHRSDHAEAPGDRRRVGGRTRRLAARRARSDGDVDGQPAAARVAAAAAGRRSTPIRDRLDAVEELAFRTTERGKFRDAIKTVQDLERLVARAALGTAGPRDLVGAEAVAR